MGLGRPVWYVSDFHTGNLSARDLPLEGVTYGASLDAGTFTASLDLRKMCRDVEDARDVLQWLTPGTFCVAPLYEGLWSGTSVPPVTRCTGEWWIHRIETSWASPIVRLHGVEFSGYTRHRYSTDRWDETDIDAVYLVRMAIGDAFQKGQSVAIDMGGWNSQRRIRTTLQADAGSRTYWDLAADMAAGRFEWKIEHRVIMEGIAPARIERFFRIGDPVLNLGRDDAVMEIVPEGYVGSLTDAHRTRTAAVNELWGFGAGSGADQPTSRHTSARPAGCPIISASAQWRDAITWNDLNPLGAGALSELQDAQRPFQITVRDFVPLVGERYPYLQAPTWSMPIEDARPVRCVAWTWASDAPDLFAMDVVPYTS